MTATNDLVAQTVALAGGTVVGRVRLQKIMYLLRKKGLEGTFTFAYHHYGPYSREVDDAISKAKAFNGLLEETQRRSADGVPFSVFTVDGAGGAALPVQLGSLPAAQVQQDLEAMKAVPSTVIEVAATIHWLRSEEKVQDWLPELRLRKGPKASEKRVGEALDLLRRLGFEEEAR